MVSHGQCILDHGRIAPGEPQHVGLVGYFYQQLSGDSGAGAVLGDFKSRVGAVGPQLGSFFPVGRQKWYLNLKGYY